MNPSPTQHHKNGSCPAIIRSWKIRGRMILRACWPVSIVSEESERPAPVIDHFWKHQEERDGGRHWCSLLASPLTQIHTHTIKHNTIQYSTTHNTHTHTHAPLLPPPWNLNSIWRNHHDDRADLILGMQSLFKISKSINTLHNVNRSNDKNHTIISTYQWKLCKTEEVEDFLNFPFIFWVPLKL